MLAALHPPVRFGCLGEREDAVDDGPEASLLHVRPDIAGDLVAQQRLELD
jgi:hypothetical protein